MGKSSNTDKLSQKQIALLHVAKRELGLSDERYRDILFRLCACESSKFLDQDGFDLVMQCFSALGFKSSWNEKNFGHRYGMATPNQVRYIRKLWSAYRKPEIEDGDASLNKWLSRYHHVSALRFVSEEMASKIIPALKAMVGRR